MPEAVTIVLAVTMYGTRIVYHGPPPVPPKPRRKRSRAAKRKPGVAKCGKK